MTGAQTILDLAGRPSARVILDRIRSESRDESEKGRWPDWSEGEALTGLVVKRVEVMPQTNPPKLRLISANPAYEPDARGADPRLRSSPRLHRSRRVHTGGSDRGKAGRG